VTTGGGVWAARPGRDGQRLVARQRPVRPLKQGRWGADTWPCHSTGWWGLKVFKPVKLVQIISNGFEFNLKLVQTLNDPKNFPKLKKIEIKYFLKGLKR
jgi:hypothetical protein